MKKLWLVAIATTVLTLSLTACGLFEERKTDYRGGTVTKPLEVPPDLSRPAGDDRVGAPGAGGAATYSDYTTTKEDTGAPPASRVLPEKTTIRIERAGTQRWLVIESQPEQVWPAMRAFFTKNQMSLVEENPKTGVMETDWIENRANVSGDFIQKYLGKVFPNLYSSGMMDKFRVRLERGQAAGTTELYLTHRGMQEVVEGNAAIGTQTVRWEPRDSDPEIEAEMLRIIMVHLGAEEKQAKGLLAGSVANERARLDRDPQGTTVLLLDDELDSAWRRVGLSLDRVGFTVEDRDRSRGIYYVRYIDPSKDTKVKKGLFDWLIGEREDRSQERYQVSLTAGAPGTRVAVLDSDGVVEKTKTGERILKLLFDQLK